MKYLHTMIRVRDLDATLRFFCEGLGLKENRRMDNEQGKYTLVFLSAPETPQAEIELTYNWGSEEDYGSARNFGHLAFRVDDIYETCERLRSMGYTIAFFMFWLATASSSLFTWWLLRPASRFNRPLPED